MKHNPSPAVTSVIWVFPASQEISINDKYSSHAIQVGVWWVWCQVIPVYRDMYSIRKTWHVCTKHTTVTVWTPYKWVIPNNDMHGLVQDCSNCSNFEPALRWNFADIFKCIFLNENYCISIKICLKFLPKGPIDSKSLLVQAMTWK